MDTMESLVEELYSIAASLKFLGVCMDEIDFNREVITGDGVAYLTEVLAQRVSSVAEKCWQFDQRKEDKKTKCF